MSKAESLGRYDAIVGGMPDFYNKRISIFTTCDRKGTSQIDMNPREVVISAIRREEPERVPKHCRFTPSSLDTFRRMTGADNPEEYFDYEVRALTFGPTLINTDFTPYHKKNLQDPNVRIDEWGVGWVRGSMYHFEDMLHPLLSIRTVEEIERYPFPDVTAHDRREGLQAAVDHYHQRGYAASIELPGIGSTIFETAWKMRGFEDFLTDMVQNPELTAALLDRITEMAVDNAAFVGECGADILSTSDDIGTQRGMLVSPELYRKWLKPRMAEVARAAKEVNPDIIILYHTCGDVYPIIGDLVEVGVDVLEPVQPECMDPELVKEEYGDRLAFWGTIGTQNTMPFCSPSEVRDVVRRRIATVGKGGGLVISPSQRIEPEVPWENIAAFFDAVEEYGRYR